MTWLFEIATQQAEAPTLFWWWIGGTGIAILCATLEHAAKGIESYRKLVLLTIVHAVWLLVVGFGLVILWLSEFLQEVVLQKFALDISMMPVTPGIAGVLGFVLPWLFIRKIKVCDHY